MAAGTADFWAAGQSLAAASTRSLLERLLGAPFFSAPLAEIASVREINRDELDAGPFPIATRVQELHAEPTLALRIGDALTYCTDTAPDPGNVSFAAGSRVLLHEAWYAQATSDDGNHSAGGDAGRIAREAGAERLVLIHINPLQPSDEALAESAQAEFAAAEVGVDLASIPLG
jgi:ribonuclease BN (tRNA processing enzyme)